MVRQAAAKNWIFVWNNWTEDAEDVLKELYPETVQYMVYGKEEGKEGTPHLQGYLQLVKKKRRRQLSNLLPMCFLDPQSPDSTVKQAIVYCKKDGNFTEIGTPTTKGKRSDLEKVKDAIEDGATEQELASTFFPQWVRYHQAFKRYREIISKDLIAIPKFQMEEFPDEWIVMTEDFLWTTCLIIRGESGIGKTEFAKALLPGAMVASHTDDLLQFTPEKYTGIIFDDMKFDHYPRSAQIHIADIDNPRSIHCRYNCAFIPANTKKIFTTNEQDIFLDDPAIRRRITYMTFYKP